MANQKADKSYTDTLVTAINAAPKGVFATLAALQADSTANTADGKKNIYLVSADGKWYFWNGSAWTAGAVYQATSIADGTVTTVKIADKSVTLKKYADGSLNLAHTDFCVPTKNYIRNDEAFWAVGDWSDTATHKMICGKAYLPVDINLFAQIKTTLDSTALNINQMAIRLFTAGNAYIDTINIYATSGTFSISSATYPTYSYARIRLTNSGSTPLVLADFFGGDPFIQVEKGTAGTLMTHSHVVATGKESITPTNLENGFLKRLRKGTVPDFKIVLISDIHANSNDSIAAVIRLPHMINALNAEDAIGKIDCVIMNGDSVSNTSVIDHIPNLKRDYLSQLWMPYYAVAGNHEHCTDEMWQSHFGYDKSYILSFKGLDVVVIDMFTDDTVANPDLYGWGAADISSDWADAVVSYLTNSSNGSAIVVGHYINNYTNIMKIMNHAKVVCGCVGHIHDEVSTILNGKTLYRDGHYSFFVTHDMPWAYRVIQSVSGELSTYMVHPAAAYPEFDYTGSPEPTLSVFGLVPAWEQEYETLPPVVLKTGYPIKVMYP
jgi:predicted phosphodiesterase